MSIVDSWTGEPIEGKAIILTTTDGPSDFVAPVTMRADVVAQALAELTARVEALESAVTDPGPELGVEE